MEEKKKDRVLLFLNNCTTLTPIVEVDDPENESFETDENIVGFTESTILVGDGVYNNIYFPAEELEKAFHTWDNQPLNMNHSEDIKDEVGYITKPRYDTQTKQLKVTPILNKETSGYKDANGYIHNRMKAGKPPEVSIGVWIDREYELMEDGETERLTARNLQGDHLALVSRGACSPEAGCGIGLSNESENYLDLEEKDNANYTIMFAEGVELNNHINLEENLMEDKKLEEMRAKIALLEKEKAQRQLDELEKEAAQAEQLQKEAEKEKLHDEIRSEVMEELGQKSQIVTDEKPATLAGGNNSKFQVFLNDWGKNHNIDTTESYEEWVHNHCNRFGYMEKK